jgi:hypothetical protein
VTTVAFWLRLVLVATFVDAVLAHARGPARIERTIAAAGIPAPRGVALALTVAEVALIGLLAAAPTFGSLTVLLYLGAVTLPMLIAVRRGARIEDCACGTIPRPVDARLAVRNGLLAAAAIFVSLVPQPSMLEPAAWIASVLLGIKEFMPRLIRRLAEPPRPSVTYRSG